MLPLLHAEELGINTENHMEKSFMHRFIFRDLSRDYCARILESSL